MTEEQLHKQICKYIKLQYPNVLFNTDLSGVKLTKGQANKIKDLRSGRGFPDITIFESIGRKYVEHENGENVIVFLFCGLHLEVKKETPYKKDGSLKKETRKVYKKVGRRRVLIEEYDHLAEQNEVHKRLRKQGYFAVFVWSFDMAKKTIDEYMSIK